MFKKLHYTIILILMANYMLLSQNIVLNGSFEDFSSCPNTYGQLNKAVNWFSANGGGGGSSEYFNACNNPNICGVPNNGFTYQYARTGNAYAGTGCYGYGNEDREYVEGTLNNALFNGVEYCVIFYVSLYSYSSYGIDALGLYFTTDSLITYSSDAHYVKPQISNDSLNVITDTINWVKISGTFTASGGERFFTFGNFKKTSQTTAVNINGYINGYAYYLLDDVAVYPCNAPIYTANAGGDKTICPGESIGIGMQDYDEYVYRWYDSSGALLDTTASINVTPSATTTYILWIKDFKYDVTTDTVTVLVDEDCNKSTVVYVPNIFSPNNDGNNDILYVRSANIQELNFSIYNRWGEKVFETHDKNEGWNGNYKGKQCPPGVYYYMAEVVFTNGEKLMKKGNVTLVR